jgi:hypothetical protein
MWCSNMPAIGGQANVPSKCPSRCAPSLLERFPVCRQPPITRSLHVLTGMSGELDRASHSRRPRKRSCDSMTDSSSCARPSPARPLLGLLLGSLSIWRSAAATRSRARSRSATVYCRGSGRVRFLRGPFAAHLQLTHCERLSRSPRRRWREG